MQEMVREIIILCITQCHCFLSEKVSPLGEFDALGANTSGLSQHSVAQDRIRLAPKGRRKPTRFSVNPDGISKAKDSKKSTEKRQAALKPKSPDVERPSKIEEVVKNDRLTKSATGPCSDTKDTVPSVPKRPPAIDKAKQPPPVAEKAKKPMLPVEKVSPKLDLSDVVIIQALTEEKPQCDASKLTAPASEDFGSWEHITGPKGRKGSLEKEALNKSSSSLKVEEEEKILVQSDARKEICESDDVPAKCKATKTSAGLNNEDFIEVKKGQEILDMIEGKAEKVAGDKLEVQTEKELLVKGTDASLKKDSISSETDAEKAPFDALVSRTRRLSEGQTSKSDESKKGVRFSPEESPSENSPQKNWSFELNDLDDMRSTDLQPVPFQRSKSLSDPQKPVEPLMLKCVSVDNSMEQQKDKGTEGRASKKRPDWIAIAKEKHQRNASTDEETLEETTEEIQDIALQVSEICTISQSMSISWNLCISHKRVPKQLSKLIETGFRKVQRFFTW